MTRPRIAVAPCFFHADHTRAVFKGKTLLYQEESIGRWLMAGGALPYMIPRAAPGVITEALLEGFHGLLLQGGSDVAPESYGEAPRAPEWTGDRARDLNELELIRRARARGMPVLGVCRGLHIINIGFGGTLYQDIGRQRPDALIHRGWARYDALTHELHFESGALLEACYPDRRGGQVNSVHHQAVKELGREVRAEASSPHDGIVEALRAMAGPFLYAVQWHPEFQDSAADSSLLDPAPIRDLFLAEARQLAARQGEWGPCPS